MTRLMVAGTDKRSLYVCTLTVYNVLGIRFSTTVLNVELLNSLTEPLGATATINPSISSLDTDQLMLALFSLRTVTVIS